MNFRQYAAFYMSERYPSAWGWTAVIAKLPLLYR